MTAEYKKKLAQILEFGSKQKERLQQTIKGQQTSCVICDKSGLICCGLQSCTNEYYKMDGALQRVEGAIKAANRTLAQFKAAGNTPTPIPPGMPTEHPEECRCMLCIHMESFVIRYFRSCELEEEMKKEHPVIYR